MAELISMIEGAIVVAAETKDGLMGHTEILVENTRDIDTVVELNAIEPPNNQWVVLIEQGDQDVDLRAYAEETLVPSRLSSRF